MDAIKRVTIISFLGLVLTSCSIGARESFSDTPSDSYGGSNSSLECSESESGSIGSLSASLPANSTSRVSKTYYTVSIYQSFYLPKEDKYGDPKYDTRFKVEAFAPFYKDADAFNELESQCHPSGEFNYPHPGGVYMMIAFFYDVTCKREILYGDPVTSNTSIYYYCR